MHKTRLDFLKRYMETICPTGFEEEASHVWRKEADKFADRTWVDQHGNSFAVVNEKGSPRIMLAGHADEIGLMVTHIDENGYLYFTGLGGWDLQILPGQRVRIKTKKGIVLGVVGRKAIHLLDVDERKKVVKMEGLWIDIGAKDRKEAEKLIGIGDPGVLDYEYAELRNGLVTARGFDDRIGAFVVLEAARLATKTKPKAAIYAVATVQEEIGLRGATTSAFGIDPQVGIAVDVGFATDTPAMSEEKKRVGDVKMGGGPIVTRGPNVNAALFDRIVKTAKASDIPIQIHAHPRPTGTDARAIQVTRAGVATGLIGVPSRYMHSPSEIVHVDDVENCAKLIAETIAGIGPKTSFLPS
jgi:putative aminopeptidase FrvX